MPLQYLTIFMAVKMTIVKCFAKNFDFGHSYMYIHDFLCAMGNIKKKIMHTPANPSFTL